MATAAGSMPAKADSGTLMSSHSRPATNGTLLGVLARQQAWYTAGFGCTLASERPGLATPQGVYLFGFTKGWTFDSWTTGG